MTANVTNSAKARIPVEFSQFVLFGYFGDASMSDLERPADAGWVGCAGRGGAVFHASDQSIAAHIEFELWSEQPAVDDAAEDLAASVGRSSPARPTSASLPREHARGARWVEPRLVGEVEFRQWTSDGRLRHPAWRGMRPDRNPLSVVLPSTVRAEKYVRAGQQASTC